ncbi:C4-type zinc ribbon domain-containing protein [Acidothermaceae bacterium B102]|nr:C4-type zinc ribbon domain-containing protein [Acidothermaceae bacterium B102]
MKADPFVQLRLLDLQALDTTLDQLAHRRATLPEIAELASLDSRLAGLRDEIVRVSTEDHDLGREQSKIETDVELVATRAKRDQQRLDSGAITSPKELENLQHEIGSLGRRQGDLEDQVLEVMEKREEVQGRLEILTRQREELTAVREQALERQTVAFTAIDADRAKATDERATLGVTIPDDLLALYEKVRASNGGTGAAALYRGACQGCHLSLSGQDLAEVRDAPSDEVRRCEECRRILIRTGESGL